MIDSFFIKLGAHRWMSLWCCVEVDCCAYIIYKWEVVVLYCFLRASGGFVLNASLNFKFGLFSW